MKSNLKQLKAQKAHEAMAASKAQHEAKSAPTPLPVVPKVVKVKVPREKKVVFDDENVNTGRWTSEEKALFDRGLQIYGKGNWTKIRSLIPQR